MPINAEAAIDALIPGKIQSIAEALVFNLRLPRMLVAILLGSNLALADALLQV